MNHSPQQFRKRAESKTLKSHKSHVVLAIIGLNHTQRSKIQLTMSQIIIDTPSMSPLFDSET